MAADAGPLVQIGERFGRTSCRGARGDVDDPAIALALRLHRREQARTEFPWPTSARKLRSASPVQLSAERRLTAVSYREIGPFKSQTPVTPRRSTIGRLCEIFHPSFVRLKSVRYSPVMVTEAAPVASLVLTPSQAAVMVAASPSTLINLLVTMWWLWPGNAEGNRELPITSSLINFAI